MKNKISWEVKSGDNTKHKWSKINSIKTNCRRPHRPKKTHKPPINALSIAGPLGVNALESGKISRKLVLAGNSGYHCNLLTSSLIRVVHIWDISKLGWLIGSFATVLTVGCWPKGSKSSDRVATLKPLDRRLAQNFLCTGWNSYTAVTRSPEPRL
jgi:hypothetical protein